jgi:hypothetical protein
MLILIIAVSLKSRASNSHDLNGKKNMMNSKILIIPLQLI